MAFNSRAEHLLHESLTFFSKTSLISLLRQLTELSKSLSNFPLSHVDRLKYTKRGVAEESSMLLSENEEQLANGIHEEMASALTRLQDPASAKNLAEVCADSFVHQFAQGNSNTILAAYRSSL